MHLILFDHVCFGYPDNQMAIQNCSLKIAHGDSVAIVGANGAGKSTLLRLMAGLLIADKGSITIDGLTVGHNNVNCINRKIGYVGQDDYNQTDSTVNDYIAYAPRSCGYTEIEIQSLTAYAINTMHLQPLSDRKLKTLSCGERRIAAIAATLAKQPSVMLFDDPTAFLDAKARHSLINSLQTLHHTKVIATHNLDLALALCSKVIVLKEGSVYAYGNAQMLLRNVSLLQTCSLELPLSAQKYNNYIYQK